MLRRSSIASTSRTLRPPTSTSPEVGSISRFTIFSAVVLPQPEDPTIVRNSPLGTRRSKWESTVFSP